MATVSDSILRTANRFFDRTTGGLQRPVFFDIDATRPELRLVDRAFPEIREELTAILARRAEIPRYHELDPLQRWISTSLNAERDWKVFYLYAMGEKPEANRRLCPRTCAVLDRVPGLFQAFFSILDPGKSIPAHCGPFRGYLRYHLGLVVPSQSPPSIRIRDQWYTWREGESLLFDDGWEHQVRNVSPDERIVLIVDIRRPMPFPYSAVNRALAVVLRYVYGRKVMKQLR